MTYLTERFLRKPTLLSHFLRLASIGLVLIALPVTPASAQQPWSTPDPSGNINNTNTGNVGIGTTTSPLYKIQILGTNANPSLTAASGIVAVDGGVGSNQLTIGSYAARPFGFWLQTKDNCCGGGSGWSQYPISLNPLGGNVGIGVAAPGERLTIVGVGNTSGSAGLSVWNSSLVPMLYVRNDGNVGISTTSPGAKLDVIGGATIRESE